MSKESRHDAKMMLNSTFKNKYESAQVHALLYIGDMIAELIQTLKTQNEAKVNTGFYIGDKI